MLKHVRIPYVPWVKMPFANCRILLQWLVGPWYGTCPLFKFILTGRCTKERQSFTAGLVAGVATWHKAPPLRFFSPSTAFFRAVQKSTTTADIISFKKSGSDRKSRPYFANSDSLLALLRHQRDTSNTCSQSAHANSAPD